MFEALLTIAFCVVVFLIVSLVCQFIYTFVTCAYTGIKHEMLGSKEKKPSYKDDFHGFYPNSGNKNRR